MGLVFLIVIGAMLGWLAAIITRADSAAAKLRNVLTGVAGALITGLVINPLVGGSDLLDGQYGIDSLVLALTGSVVVLLLAHVWRDGELS
ncbi:MAG TPA: GlsB/YeaQ/YmgE family stress response membrane protein [Croceibacterium sp.]|nr:GlsB/YeaQ/YmgE family stress response membrane protein [Croceibacterium sp.]